jgi:hypothetical protein
MHFEITSISVEEDGSTLRRVRVSADPHDELARCGLSDVEVVIAYSASEIRSWIVAPGEPVSEAHGRSVVAVDGDAMSIAREAVARILV